MILYDCSYSCFKLTAYNIFQNLVKELGLGTVNEFKNMLKEGAYAYYWNRIYLVGPFGVGKTTLAKNLVGDAIPEMWASTDGVWIYMGRAGMDTFSGGRSRSTRTEPQTMGKQLVNFIACGCESSAPFLLFTNPGANPRRVGDRFVSAKT
jgi:hypothetical protein